MAASTAVPSKPKRKAFAITATRRPVRRQPMGLFEQLRSAMGSTTPAQSHGRAHRDGDRPGLSLGMLVRHGRRRPRLGHHAVEVVRKVRTDGGRAHGRTIAHGTLAVEQPRGLTPPVESRRDPLEQPDGGRPVPTIRLLTKPTGEELCESILIDLPALGQHIDDAPGHHGVVGVEPRPFGQVTVFKRLAHGRIEEALAKGVAKRKPLQREPGSTITLNLVTPQASEVRTIIRRAIARVHERLFRFACAA